MIAADLASTRSTLNGRGSAVVEARSRQVAVIGPAALVGAAVGLERYAGTFAVAVLEQSDAGAPTVN